MCRSEIGILIQSEILLFEGFVQLNNNSRKQQSKERRIIIAVVQQKLSEAKRMWCGCI